MNAFAPNAFNRALRFADLPEMFIYAFDKDNQLARRIRGALDYTFNAEYAEIEDAGLAFRLILNEGRFNYVAKSLAKLRKSWSNVKMDSLHRSPPGSVGCPFCGFERSKMFIGRINGGLGSYGILANKRPWGRHHVVVVSQEKRGQMLAKPDLLTCFDMLRSLGSQYEATFSSAFAGASVLHLHFQIHQGAASVWRNLQSRRVPEIILKRDNGVSIGYTQKWPAQLILLSGQDEDVASAICGLLQMLLSRNPPIPYNIGIRYDGAIMACIAARSVKGERPTALNAHKDSWGRFSFNEMGGSIVLLTRKGFEATKSAPESIRYAIKEMSITARRRAELLNEIYPKCGR